jgi:hypothetical protein
MEPEITMVKESTRVTLFWAQRILTFYGLTQYSKHFDLFVHLDLPSDPSLSGIHSYEK